MSQYPPYGQPDPFGQQPNYPPPGYQPPSYQQPNYQQPSYQSPYQSPQGGPGYGQQPPKLPLNTLALTSTITGVVAIFLTAVTYLGFFCCCGGGFFVAIIIGSVTTISGVAAVVTGHMAWAQLKNEPDKESGKELAIIGMATGYPAIVFTVLLIILSIFIFTAAIAPAMMNKNRPPF